MISRAMMIGFLKKKAMMIGANNYLKKLFLLLWIIYNIQFRIWMRPWRNQLRRGRLPWATIPWGVSVIMVTLRSYCNYCFQSFRYKTQNSEAWPLQWEGRNLPIITVSCHLISRPTASISTSTGMTTAWNTSAAETGQCPLYSVHIPTPLLQWFIMEIFFFSDTQKICAPLY